MTLTPETVSAAADLTMAVVAVIALYATWRSVSSWQDEQKSAKKSEMAERVFLAAVELVEATVTAPGALHEPNAIDLAEMKRKHPGAGADIVLLFPFYRLERAHQEYKSLRGLEEHVRHYFGEDAHAALSFLLYRYKGALRGAADTAELFDVVHSPDANPEESRRQEVMAEIVARKERLHSGSTAVADDMIVENMAALKRILAPFLHFE